LYINDPPPRTNSLVSILIVMNKGCIASKLTLKFDKVNLRRFVAKNKPVTNLQISYDDDQYM